MEKFKKYTYSYHHGTSQWSFDLQAESMEDAQARVDSIMRTLRLDGELHACFPSWVPVWLVFCWLSFKDWYSGSTT